MKDIWYFPFKTDRSRYWRVQSGVRAWAELPDEAVDQSVGCGLRRGARRSRFANHPKSLDEANQDPRCTCGLDIGCQFACFLRARECAGEPGLHGLEKIVDAACDLRVVASQFHRGGHQQAAAPAIRAAGAGYIARKEGPQAINRCAA